MTKKGGKKKSNEQGDESEIYPTATKAGANNESWDSNSAKTGANNDSWDWNNNSSKSGNFQTPEKRKNKKSSATESTPLVANNPMDMSPDKDDDVDDDGLGFLEKPCSNLSGSEVVFEDPAEQKNWLNRHMCTIVWFLVCFDLYCLFVIGSTIAKEGITEDNKHLMIFLGLGCFLGLPCTSLVDAVRFEVNFRSAFWFDNFLFVIAFVWVGYGTIVVWFLNNKQQTPLWWTAFFLVHSFWALAGLALAASLMMLPIAMVGLFRAAKQRAAEIQAAKTTYNSV